MNSEVKPICRVAQNIVMKLESWAGNVKFSMAPMDGFKIILSIKFLYKTKMVPMPYLGMINIFV